MRFWRRCAVVGLFATPMVTATLIPPAPAAPAACVAPALDPASTVDVAASGFSAITPTRIADTRTGQGVALAPIGSGCVLRVPLAPAGPPPGAVAVALNVTSDRAPEAGFVTAYPCGSNRPDTSVLNQRQGDPTPNLAVVAIDSTSQVCLYADHETDLIVDVTGWFTPSGALLHDITPVRVLDTRRGDIPNGVPAGTVGGRSVSVGIAGPFVPAEAEAVAVTLTITQATEPTYATVYPCGTPVPPTSTTNTVARKDRGAPALVGLGGGALCVYSSAPAHLVVDVTAWYGPDQTGDAEVGSPLESVSTTRIADSRNAVAWPRTPFAAGDARSLDLLSSVPLGTTSVQLNVIATNARDAGYLTVYPCGTGRPTVSSVNYTRGSTETAMATIALDDDAKVCVYASAQTDVIVDLFAAYGSRGSFHALVASPNSLDQGLGVGQLDHSLRCPATGQVTLDLDPAPGVKASIDGGPPTPGARRVVRTGLAADALIAIDLTGAVTERHYVRCLPADFPALIATGAATTPGWYVASTLGPNYVFILDQYGVPVWYKKTTAPVIAGWTLTNGNLAWRKWTGGGFPGGNGSPESPPLGFEIHDLSGAKVGDVGPVGGTEPLDWHELLELPGGGHTVVTYPVRDAGGSPRSCTKATDGTSTTTTWVVDSDIVELDAGGNEVWRWSSANRTSISEVQIPVCFAVGFGIFALDYMHLNSVDRLPDGDYVISARHFNSIERIDRTTGNVEWKLGGTPPATGIALTVRDADGNPVGAGGRLIGPHDARVAPNGNITVHDNHIGGAPRANEYRLDLGANAATLVSQRISANPFGGTLGSMRRQTDGSVVIAWGEGHQPWLEDVSPSGVSTLQVTLPSNVTAYRGVKVPTATFDRDVLRAASGGTAA